MFDAERLVKPQFPDAELPIELGHLLLKVLRVRCGAQRLCQRADAVPHPAVEDFPCGACVPVIHEHLDAPCAKMLLHRMELIVKELLEDAEVVERHLVDAPLNGAYNLAGCAVGIFIIDKEERQVSVPEVPLKAMAHREFQQRIDALKEQAS